MDEDERVVPIDAERLERILTAVALASTGSFEGAVTALDAAVEDDFGIVEEALRVFLVELRDANAEAADALDNLMLSKQELEQKLETIATQRAAIRELSTPIIDVWEGILTLPLIGFIDSERATDITEALLRRVGETKARWVLIDLTGVAAVDEMTADHLLRMIQTVDLIGSRCILTGIGPQLASSLMSYGGQLQHLRPMRTLREGLQYCIPRSPRSRAR